MRETLSTRQRKMLAFIASFVNRNAYPPTLREICRGAGVSSTSVATRDLNQLERMGYLTRRPNMARSIVLETDRLAEVYCMETT